MRLTFLKRRRCDDRELILRTLKSLFDLKISGSIISDDDIHENRSRVARRSDGTTGRGGMGTSCECGFCASRKEEHLARTREEGDEVRDERQSERMRRFEPQKKKTELREVRKAPSIPLSGHETKPQLTWKIKEVQARPRTRTTTTGNPGLRTTPREVVRVGVCPPQTVLRVVRS